MKPLVKILAVILVAAVAFPAAAQTCTPSDEMDASTHSALEQTARQLFRMTAGSQTEQLRASAIPSLANNFGSITAAVVQNNPDLAGSQAALESLYELQTSGSAKVGRADFYCGIYNSPNRVAFSLSNLPPGDYAIAIFDATGGKKPYSVSFILQQVEGAWKLAGLYMLPKQAAGHDGNWYVQQARAYKSAGQLHDAWFYYMLARQLLAPVGFISTPQLDTLYQEQQQANPGDLPAGKSVALEANGKTYELTDAFPSSEMDKLYLVVRFKPSGGGAATTADNLAVTNAVMAKYPDLKSAFSTVVAQAE